MKTISSLIVLLSLAMTTIKAQNLKSITYFDGGQKLQGLISKNTATKLPGVLILPAWKGIDEEAKNAALALAKEGYIAFIADIYGEGNIPADNASAAKIATKFKDDYKAYQHRINLAMNQLKKYSSTNIAVIGYCFGGTGALETARAGLDVKGVISIHGGLSKSAERPNTPIKTKILIENPANDKSVTKEVYENLINEMNEGKADWQIITYAGCGHTFTDPQSPEYNELMAKRAWQHTLLFLKEVLK